MKRTIIKIDSEKCNGCGLCVKGCHEGALQMINGKAVMVSELYCDGLGACIGDCPVDAITLEEREAAPYDEEAVMERLIPKGEQVIIAHLNHLKSHNEHKLLEQGLDYLKKKGVQINVKEKPQIVGTALGCGCPGSMAREIKRERVHDTASNLSASRPFSELRQFPVQLHLLNPHAGFLQNSDLLLAADCTAFAYGDFHNRFLKDKKLAIACPKLDNNIDTYIDKLAGMIDHAEIRTLTVVIMEVPCCRGLVKIAHSAREKAQRDIPVKVIILSIDGEIISENWT